MSTVSPATNPVVFNGTKINKTLKLVLTVSTFGILFIIGILGITIATFVKVNNQSTSASETTPNNDLSLASTIRIDEVMYHLKEFQRIATENKETRAASTLGFNQTLDYIVQTLKTHTDFKVSMDYFDIRQFALNSEPILISSVDGVSKTYTYSTNLAIADFYYIKFSTGANFTDFADVTAIPNVGCTDADWLAANPPVSGRIALVKRGICAFSDKGIFAGKYNARGLLIYNDGTDANRMTPLAISLGQENQLPALFLSYSVGQALVNAAQNATLNTGVRLIINTQNLPDSPIGNICADTPTGEINQTIVIGSHSDSVEAGPGINDNGSGSAANLGLALALARLFQTAAYEKYKYRIRFCWWGAEELGLLGAEDHVKKAKTSSTPGERLSDYLINLNYDMLASPNFIFGIYNGNSASDDTPSAAIDGSVRITNVFKEWFEQKNLPWTYTAFDGRSDYGPFLAAGIVAGGLFSGADGKKTQEQRDYYDEKLGQGMGGIVNAIYDPCYHELCDSIQNINVYGYEKMIEGAAYMLEYLARKNDLQSWLYPNGRSIQIKRNYNSINEYFQMPSF